MFHITLIGHYAGATVCGASLLLTAYVKDIEGDTYAHAGDWLDNPEILVCPKCREVWDSLESDRKQSYVLVIDPDEFERLLRQLVNGEDEDGH
jgi:Zn-finger nucleic acid-binding protein